MKFRLYYEEEIEADSLEQAEQYGREEFGRDIFDAHIIIEEVAPKECSVCGEREDEDVDISSIDICDTCATCLD